MERNRETLSFTVPNIPPEDLAYLIGRIQNSYTLAVLAAQEKWAELQDAANGRSALPNRLTVSGDLQPGSKIIFQPPVEDGPNAASFLRQLAFDTWHKNKGN